VIPTTAAAKRAFFGNAARPWLVKVLIVLRALEDLAWQIGPLMLGLLALNAAPCSRVLQVFVAIFVAFFGIMFAGGLSHNWHRYLYVLVPLLVAALAYTRAHASFKDRHWPTALILVTALYAVPTAPMHLQRYTEAVAFTRVEHEGVADWIHRNVPDDARIAVHDAGFLAFATDYPLIDVVGLKTPASQSVHEAITGPSAGLRRGEALARILIDTRSEYLVLLNGWERIFAVTAGLRGAGIELTPLRPEARIQVLRIGATQ
jgi:hypothetical protein